LASVEASLDMYKPSDKNDEYLLSSWDFEFYDSNMTEVEMQSVVIADELHAKMFEGGKAKGEIYAIVPEGEKVLIRYNDIAWYSIS